MQAVDDYRILGIAKPSEGSDVQSLVLYDTSGPQARRTVFELPSNKLAAIYVPQRFMGSPPMRRSTGLHRADPNQRIIGVACRASYGSVRLSDDYIIIINTADLRVYASTQSVGELRIRWEEWRSFATIVRVELSITTATCVSGSNFFALIGGPSHLGRQTLLRIYDFSPGAVRRRDPNTSAVRDLVVDMGRVGGQSNSASWALSEDNLLMFHVSAGYWTHGFLGVSV